MFQASGSFDGDMRVLRSPMAPFASGAVVHVTLSHSVGSPQVVNGIFLRSEHSSSGKPVALLAVSPAALPPHLQSDQREVEAVEGSDTVKVCLTYVVDFRVLFAYSVYVTR